MREQLPVLPDCECATCQARKERDDERALADDQHEFIRQVVKLIRTTWPNTAAEADALSARYREMRQQQ